MRTTARFVGLALLGLASSLVSAPLAHAQVGARLHASLGSGVRTYHLTNDQTLDAEVLSVADGKVTMRVHAGGGTLQRTLAIDELEPTSALRAVESVTPEDDAEKQLELARFAAANGLVATARRALSAARTASGDPEYGAEVAATIDSAGADVLIQRYREDLDAGRLREAERNLDTALARYPDQFDAERQRSLQQGLAQARAEVERGVQQEAEAREAREAAEERNRELRPLQQRLDRGQKSYERALAESKNSSTANRHLDSAIRDLRHVVEGADRLLADDQSDQVLAKQASRLRETATSRLVDALLTSASLYTVRGQFNPAIGRVNEALLLDEGNARALAMRGRIEVAANEQQWGWGW